MVHGSRCWPTCAQAVLQGLLLLLALPLSSPHGQLLLSSPHDRLLLLGSLNGRLLVVLPPLLLLSLLLSLLLPLLMLGLQLGLLAQRVSGQRRGHILL